MSGKVLEIAPVDERARLLTKRMGVRRFRSYVTRSGGGITSVSCKGCDVELVHKGRPTREYSEMTIEFDDGSKHVSPMCRRCAVRPHTQAELDQLYTTDVLELYEDEKFSGDVKNPLEMLLARKPLKSKRTFNLKR